jgi:hypothetical protein
MMNIAADIVNGIKMMNLFCEKCKEIFAIPARRGRPPKFCRRCTDGGAYESSDNDAERLAELRAKAEARVDRLEMMLKAAGNHISQHRHKWEQ